MFNATVDGAYRSAAEIPELPGQETPEDFIGSALLLAALPAQVSLLEKISEALDGGDWEEALNIGLMGALVNVGAHFETGISASDHPKAAEAGTMYRQTVDAYEMAERILEKERMGAPEQERYSSDEKQSAVRVLRVSVDSLARSLGELHASASSGKAVPSLPPL